MAASLRMAVSASAAPSLGHALAHTHGPQHLVARLRAGRLEITAAAGGAGFFAPAPRIVIRSTRGSSDRSRHEAVLVVAPSFDPRSHALLDQVPSVSPLPFGAAGAARG